MNNHITGDDIATGIAGTLCSVTLAIPVYHEEIEFTIKVMSGLLSGVAACFTIVAMYHKIKKYGNNNL